jgi:DNA-binding NtrC family response regulator
MTANRQYTILIIEDDSTMREGIHTVLEKERHLVYSAEDGLQGLALYHEHHPDLVITDLKLPGKSGMHLLQEILELSPDLPVILISAFGTIDLAVNALKTGARDFIAKPFSIDELKAKVADIFKTQMPQKLVGESLPSYHGMIGSSPAIILLQEQGRQIAKVSSPVLITGESGTGKELLAKAIHTDSDRSNKIFLAVNCGAFTDTLLESELFGHEQGAFTGAIKQHKGIFEQADGGTILLDEIGEVSPKLQVKLLRVLQEQTFQRVGGTQEQSVDVRIIAATNRDLREAIKAKQFREDLYFRLNVLPINVPPLRERREDITDLINYIIRQKCKSLGREEPTFDAEAISKLQTYNWPGNIRELENLLERILVFSPQPNITASEIYLDQSPPNSPVAEGTLPEVLENTEYEMIKSALEKSGGVKQKAAKLLGIKTSTLYYKLEKYGLFEE